MSAAVSIATPTWHDLEPNIQDEQFLVPGKSNSLFPVKFCYILRAYLGKKSVIYVQNMFTWTPWLHSVIIHKIYLKPCHDHCLSLTHFQNNMQTHNDLARRLFTFKRFQYCRFQNTFRLAFSPKFVVNLPITFAVCKFVWTWQIWRWLKNSNKYGGKFVRNVILQCIRGG